MLLRNEGVLPLDPGALALARRDRPERRPRADHGRRLGQAARALPRHAAGGAARGARRTPSVRHERGCDIDRTAPELRAAWRIEFEGGRSRRPSATPALLLFDAPTAGDDRAATPRARSSRRARPAPHTFTLAPGRARAGCSSAARSCSTAFADPPPRGEAMIGLVSEEIAAEVALTAGEPVELRRRGHGRGRPRARCTGAVVGLRPPAPDDLIERAAAAAAACDAAVLVVGTTDEWETRGLTTAPSMDLPGDQDALVEARARRQPGHGRRRQRRLAGHDALGRPRPRGPAHAGSAARRWPARSPTCCSATRDPGGRLPTTHPLRARAQPLLRQLPRRERRGPLRRGRADRLPLVRRPRACPCASRSATASPTRPSRSAPRALSAETFAPGGTLTVEVDVTNTSDRAGLRGRPALRRAAAERARPPAAGAARLRQGRTSTPARRTTVALELADRAFACWDPGDPSWESLLPRAAASPLIRSDEARRTTGGWRIDPGTYVLHVGRSSADLPHAVPLRVA